MFIKINNGNQDYFLNLDKVLSLSADGPDYFILTYISGQNTRISLAEAQIIVPLLPTANNVPLTI
jgi:hypothetical protein